MLGKFLGLGRMRSNIFFLFEIFFKKKYFKKTGYFNTGLVSYNVSIQPNIKQTWWKNI
jgi:hypothetical protein